MKVLHVNTFDTGGAAKACSRIHQSLLDIGIESKMLVRNKTDYSVPEVYEIWENLNVITKTKKIIQQKIEDQLQQKAMDNDLKELYSFPSSIWDVTQNKHFIEADIIHLHWVAGFVDYLSFFKQCKKKIVWTLHDFSPFSGGFHYPTNEVSNELRKLQKTHFDIKRLALDNSKITIVSPSTFLSIESSKSEIFQKNKHQIIGNTVGSKFKFIKVERSKYKLLFVAQELNYERKGMRILLDAIDLLAEGYIEVQVVGKLNDSRILGVKNLGVIIDESELNRVYASADIVVVPSHNDNFPNTIAEALCSGTPVVAFAVGGIPEMINDTNGVLVHEISAKKLASGISKALNQKWNNGQISSDALLEFGAKKCATSYIDIYRSLKV